MVTSFYPPHHFGGDATYVRALSRELVRRGHEVEVVYCEDGFNALGRSVANAPVECSDGVLVHRLKSRLGVLSPLITQQTGRPGLKSSRLKEILANNFDVVNFHNISLVGGPGVLRLSQAPVNLYTLHEHWLLCATHILWKNKKHACDHRQCFRCAIRSGIPPQLWRYTSLVNKCLESVDRLLAPSQFTAEQHAQSGIVNEIKVLPLFSQLDPGEENSETTPTANQFIYVGRVTASKGLLPVLKLFSRLVDLTLQVIGDGDQLEALKSAFSQYDNIIFSGAIEQSMLVHHYQSATALILPSLAPETFGLTIVEAFACGTPALVRDAGGSKELIEISGGGLVYSNDEELEYCVKRFSADTTLRKELGRKARNGFKNHFSADHHMHAYFDHIEQIQHQKGLGSQLAGESI